MGSKFRGRGTPAIIVKVFKSDAKLRDVPALKPDHYAILGVTEKQCLR